MAKRKPLSKKQRFDIFKRDAFTCQYCGQTPPSVVLNVDHINPVSKGGDNSEENLMTACFDCNNGKRATPLNVAPETLAKKAEIIAAKEEQLREYNKILAAQKRRTKKQIKQIQGVFQSFFPNHVFCNDFEISVGRFLKKLPFYDVEEAMELAGNRVKDPEGCSKYFCGTCWGKIRDQAT